MQENTQQAVGEASDEHADSTLQAVETQQEETVQKQEELAESPPDPPPETISGNTQTVQATDLHYPPTFREAPAVLESSRSPAGAGSAIQWTCRSCPTTLSPPQYCIALD